MRKRETLTQNLSGHAAHHEASHDRSFGVLEVSEWELERKRMKCDCHLHKPICREIGYSSQVPSSSSWSVSQLQLDLVRRKLTFSNRQVFVVISQAMYVQGDRSRCFLGIVEIKTRDALNYKEHIQGVRRSTAILTPPLSLAWVDRSSSYFRGSKFEVLGFVWCIKPYDTYP